MNAADYYGLDELKRACSGFIQCCVTVDTVCALLATAERYIQYKCTKCLVQKVLEFIDEHGNEVLNLGSFALLPQHVVRLILAREELKADEFSKFQAALMWSKKYCDSTSQILSEVLGSFLEYINFHMIPANVLMKEINPLGIVPYHIIMNALAYQADPSSVDPNRNPSKAGIKDVRNKTRTNFALIATVFQVRKGSAASAGAASSTYQGSGGQASGGRSMSIQSSLDPYGSCLTLSSSSSVGLGQDHLTTGQGEGGLAIKSPSRSSSFSRYSNWNILQMNLYITSSFIGSHMWLLLLRMKNQTALQVLIVYIFSIIVLLNVHFKCCIDCPKMLWKLISSGSSCPKNPYRSKLFWCSSITIWCDSCYTRKYKKYTYTTLKMIFMIWPN